MIDTISNLLNAFIDVEREKLNEQNIKHPLTIGAMYEGLTQDVLNKAIFSGLNLVVSKNSFIDNCSTEFDVILSEGPGNQIPHTSSYKYKPEQVIAVIQVKKNLYTGDLSSSYDNLKSVYDAFMTEPITSGSYRQFRGAFQQICRKDVTTYQKNLLNVEEEYIYHTLLINSIMPLRIVCGYNGYATECNFRNGFYDYLENQINTQSGYKYVPTVFPDLIICEDFSLIKLMGLPYCAQIQKGDNGWWNIIGSSHFNKMRIFLEMLWSKLTYRFPQLSNNILGDDLMQEPISRFIQTKVKSNSYRQYIGWDYQCISLPEKVLINNNEVKQWEPCEIDKAQAVVFKKLSEGTICVSNNSKLEEFVKSEGYSSLEEFVDRLTGTGLVVLEDNILKLITTNCVCVILPNGKYYAADNTSNRLKSWVLQQ